MSMDERKQMLSEMVEDGLLKSDDEDTDSDGILKMKRQLSALQHKTAIMKRCIRLKLLSKGSKEQRSIDAMQARLRSYRINHLRNPSRLSLFWFADYTKNANTKCEHAARLDVLREMRLKLRIASEILELPIPSRKMLSMLDRVGSHS